MPVCQYFLQGKCSFGDRCRNEHPKTRPSAFGQSSYQTLMSGGGSSQNRFGALSGNNGSGSAFGSGAVFGSGSAFGSGTSGGFGMSGTGSAFGSNTNTGSAFGNTGSGSAFGTGTSGSAFGSNTSSAFGNTASSAFKQPTSTLGASLSSGGGVFGNTPTKKDPNAMTVTTKHPAVNDLTSDHLKKLLSQNIQWKLTAFGPIGEKPSMISGTDISPEEMRLDFYTARQQQGGNALAMCEQKYSQLEQQIVQRVNEIINNPDKYAMEWKQQNGGGSSSSAFGQQQQQSTSTLSAFSTPTRPSAASSAFGNTLLSTGGFGLNTTTPFTSAFSTTASNKPKITTFTDDDSKSGFKYGKSAAGIGLILSGDIDANLSSAGPPRELTSEERSSYMDPTFALGKIPEMPPTAELC